MTELLGGKYEVLELAGEGGMAKVYRGGQGTISILEIPMKWNLSVTDSALAENFTGRNSPKADQHLFAL